MDGVYLCPECRGLGLGPDVPEGTRYRALGLLEQRGSAVLAVGATAITLIAALQLAISIVAPSGGTGGVQGVTQFGVTATRPPLSDRPSGPSADPSADAGGHAAATPSPTSGASASSAPSPSTRPSASSTPAASATVRPTPPAAAGDPALTLGTAVVRSWEGAYGESRLQIIVPVRNDDTRWLALPRASSTYRVIDGKGLEVASGVFTAALPAAVKPGQTGYLVDTVSVAFLEPTGDETVEAEVRATPTDPVAATLSISDLTGTTGPGGGLRVNGQVHNDGAVVTRWIMVGAIALARDGSPLGAVYDPSDIGRLAPGQVRPFDTEYPGAPPLADGAIAALIGVAFEAEP